MSGWMQALSKRRADAPPEFIQIWNTTRAVEVAHCVLVAGHGAARRKGLLGRDRLEPGTGLWIVPCEAVHTFFMRFPLDLLYLDRDKRVKKVRSHVPPWRLSACLPAHSIVELGAGALAASGTVPGDRLEFRETAPDPAGDMV